MLMEDLTAIELELIELDKVRQGMIDKAVQLVSEAKKAGNLTQECIDHYYWDSEFPDEELSRIMGVSRDIYIRKYLSEREVDAICPKCKKNVVQITVRLKEEITSKRLRTEYCPDCQAKWDKKHPKPMHVPIYKRIEFNHAEEARNIRRLHPPKINIRIQYFKDMPYGEYLKTAHWRSVRTMTLERVGFKCERCNKNNINLDVHHKTYERIGRELPCDLLVVCRPCHEKIHGRKFSDPRERVTP